MPGRISDKAKLLMEKLYAQDLPVAEIARRTNVSCITAYYNTRVKKKGFASLRKYQEYLAKERGFASLTEYEKYLAKERQQKPINQELSNLIQQRLTKIGQTQRWLAAQLGITEGAVSRYADGKTTPRKSLQKRLFNALKLPYQTLDDLLA